MHVMPARSAAPDNMLPPRGFTLIELLVVISIISLLLAVMLPTLKGARERSRQITCQSGLRQINLSTTMYADEFKGWIVPWRQKDESGNLKIWPYFLRNHLNLPRQSDNLPRTILRCPTEQMAITASAVYWTPTSYASNYYSGTTLPLFNLNYLRAPSETAIYADGIVTPPGTPYTYFSYPLEVEFRHLQAVNVAFMDTHVSSLDHAKLAGINNGNSAFQDGIP